MKENQTLVDLVAGLRIGTSARAGRLTLIAVLAPEAASDGPQPYLLYQQAQDLGLISIEEVGAAGVVGELQVANRGAQPVLLVEGEVLLGMKQTRVLNVTILVPAQTVLQVPVSCVESGRWHAVSEEATGKAAVHLAPSVRAAKTVTVARSMRSTRGFASDQGEVWAGVNRILEGHRAYAPSRSYADLHVEPAPATGDIARSVEPARDQVGVLLLVGGQVSCVDVFESPQVLRALWSGLLTSYQAEDLAADGRKASVTRTRAEKTAWDWFKSIAGGNVSVGPEIGLGAHVTVVAPGVEAAVLVNDGRVVHLSAFPAHTETSPARFVRPARRRG